MQAPAAARTLALLRRHGWNATSFQVLGPGYRYWFDGDEACVAYWDTGRAWVAAGAPIAPAHALPEAARRFLGAARAARRRACFFATESRFAAHPALDGAGGGPLASLRIGEQPVWDPAAWPGTVHAAAGLRAQLRRASAKGVTVRTLASAELADADGPMRAAVEGLIGGWLAGRRLPPMAFLLQVTGLDHLDERRCFVAEREGRLVGFLSAAPVYARGGWLVQDLLRAEAAPNGTNELLVDAAMRAAAAAGSRYVTLGLAPLAGPVPGWLRLARRSGARLYGFEGLRAFKARLRPASWASIFISYPCGQRASRTVLDALTAFAGGPLVRFGLQALRRRPAVRC